MKNKFAAIFLAALIFIGAGVNSARSQESKIYDLRLNYDKGNISLVSEIAVRSGYAPDRQVQPETGYKMDVLSMTDSVLYSFMFEAPNKICTDKIDPVTKALTGGCVEAEKSDFSFVIPYFENGKVINIYDPEGKKVFFASVEHLSKTCGDSICQEFETDTTCPVDCSANAVKEKEGIPKNLIAGVAAIIVIAAVIVVLKRKSSNIE